jgi:hypothetical protein
VDDLTDWTRLADADWVMPSDRSLADVVAELGQLLCSPDPRLRDDIGFTALGRWAREGLLDDVLVRLGDDAAQRLTHPQGRHDSRVRTPSAPPSRRAP